MNVLSRCILLVLAGSLSFCSRKAPDLTPEGAVKEFLDHVELMDGDPTQAKVVFGLLSERTRAALAERARRASPAMGRPVLPEDMLAPGRFSLRFEHRKMRARVHGDRALVDVMGIDPETDHAEVPCVEEQGRWRIEMPLPPLPAAEHRPEFER